MIRHVLVVCALLVPHAAVAQDQNAAPEQARPAPAPADPCAELLLAACQPSLDLAPAPSPAAKASLRALEVSFVALQGLDIVSTKRALDRGHAESNPLMGSVADSTAAMIGVKAGTSVVTLWLVRRLARRNHVAAVITLAAIDAAYTALVIHNFSLPDRR